MKKESPFWSSISLLIGIVIAILALIRGRMRLPLLLAVFALWLLWWLLTQALPLWRNNRAYRAKEARLREQTAAACICCCEKLPMASEKVLVRPGTSSMALMTSFRVL